MSPELVSGDAFPIQGCLGKVIYMRKFFRRCFGGYRPEHYSIFSGSFGHHGQVWF